MPNHTVLADLDIAANFLRTNYAIFVDVNIIADNHLGVAEAALLLDVAGPNDTLLSNNGVYSHGYLGEIATKYRPRLNDRLAINQYLL